MTFESTNKIELLHSKLSYKISGVLFKVHNKLGRFCREIQYGDLLEVELKNAGLSFEREKVLILVKETLVIKWIFVLRARYY